MTPSLLRLIEAERARQARPLLVASVSGMVLVSASAALLSVSGWFITGAAVAGISGVALAFNFMLPSAGIRLFAILRTAGRYGERLAGHQAALSALARIRPAVFRSLATAPVSEALALSTGEASARLVQDVDAIETLFVRLSGRWSAGAALICGVVLVGITSMEAALALAGVFAIQIAAGRLLAARLSRGPAKQMQRAAGRLKDAYASLSSAAPELACYGLQDWAADRIDIESCALADASHSLSAAQGWQGALTAALTALAAVATLLLAHSAALPLVALATLAAMVTVEGAGGLVRAFEQDGAVEEAGRRLNPILARARSAKSEPNQPCRPYLAIEADGDRVHLRPGERLVIVGHSGCGKTTLIERLMRLRPLGRGAAWIDAFDVADLSDSEARRMFAYAPQEPTLLSASIRENLMLAAPGATDDLFWGALRDAHLDAKVAGLPERLDAWIGEGGERLSGGERRRLALARAYLRCAPWLVLDEPTEGLDAETERAVLDSLQRRLSRTQQGLLLVSHRPAALGLCDFMLRLDAAPHAEALSAA